MGKYRNESGFAAVEGLLVVLILAVIGFGGYYVWHTQKTKSTTNPVASTTQTTQKSSSSSQGAIPKTYQQQYLTIKEWGVKIPLSSTISTVYYSYNSGTDFVTLSLDKYKATNCSTDHGQLYGISRSIDPSDGVKIGSYYYSPAHPQAGCDGTASDGTYDPNSAGATEAMSYVPYFKAAVSQIVAE